jgi:hypothetical protein
LAGWLVEIIRLVMTLRAARVQPQGSAASSCDIISVVS